jgi:hypothetical protein
VTTETQKTPPERGFHNGGRYWARTSHPSLSIRSSRSRPFAAVRLTRIVEPKSGGRTNDRANPSERQSLPFLPRQFASAWASRLLRPGQAREPASKPVLARTSPFVACRASGSGSSSPALCWPSINSWEQSLPHVTPSGALGQRVAPSEADRTGTERFYTASHRDPALARRALRAAGACGPGDLTVPRLWTPPAVARRARSSSAARSRLRQS